MILFLNCSYKVKSSNTEYFFQLLEKEVARKCEKECKYVSIKDVLKDIEGGSLDAFVEELKEADAWVIGAPLYVDGLPAQAVKLLELLLENYKGELPKMPVYVLSNLGFYEAEQIKHLLAIVENWCARMGVLYGGGLAVGAGPLVRALDKVPMKKGLAKGVGTGMEKLAKAITTRKKLKNFYTKTLVPRMVYLKAAHMSFDKTVKENGLSVEDAK